MGPASLLLAVRLLAVSTTSAGFHKHLPRLMKFKVSDTLLAASLALMSSGLICGAALIHESVTGQLDRKPERATALFVCALGLSHVAALPSALAGFAVDREQA